MNENDIANIVKQYGWNAVDVQDGPIPFMYTQGFVQTLGHSEVIVFGQDSKTMHYLLKKTYDHIASGNDIHMDGRPQQVINEYRISYLPVDSSWHVVYLGWSMGYCRVRNDKLTAVQLFWPDLHDKFPFELNCAAQVIALQPNLSVPKSSLN